MNTYQERVHLFYVNIIVALIRHRGKVLNPESTQIILQLVDGTWVQDHTEMSLNRVLPRFEWTEVQLGSRYLPC